MCASNQQKEPKTKSYSLLKAVVWQVLLLTTIAEHICVPYRDFEQQRLKLQAKQQSLLDQVASLEEAHNVSKKHAGECPA